MCIVARVVTIYQSTTRVGVKVLVSAFLVQLELELLLCMYYSTRWSHPKYVQTGYIYNQSFIIYN